jgi:two-component system cell cycle sensor histidine kinase/response regulator CckA
MTREELKSDSLQHQWDFYERAINNYSIIMRIMSSVEDGLLVSNIPKAFVEESFFDMCKIMVDDNGIIRQGLYSIDETLSDLDFTSIAMLNNGAGASSLINDVFGYGVLYIYPLKKDLRIIGYVVLGKRYSMDIEMKLHRELEIVCDIYNKSLLLSDNGRRREMHAKATLEMALEEFPDAFLLVDKKGFICYANKKAKGEFETKRGLLVGERLENIIPGVTHDVASIEGARYGEVQYRSGDAYKIFKVESFPLKEDIRKGEWIGIIFKDVIGKKISEEEYLLKQKMESIGMLAGGIGHDFNNILTGILGYASLMKRIVTDNPTLSRYAEAIELATQRASKLTQHLLNFSRRQKKSIGIININDLLEDVLFLAKESFRDVNMEKNLETSLPSIKGDEGELQNVFLNLIINAKDAMDGKGLLKVSTKCKKYLENKEFIIIEIEDTGRGVDEELRLKIFEPYFSTKQGGSNLGMGLYLVDQVIKDHGGFVEVESEKDKGTKFSLYIPVHSGVISTIKIEEVAFKKDILKNKSVLIVDDESMIRELVIAALADTGAKIFEAANGEEALEMFKKYRDEIDVVILDIIMPGIKGDEVLRKLRTMRKDIKVIIASGFMSGEQMKKLREDTVEAFLDKPFKDEDIRKVLIEVLSK